MVTHRLGGNVTLSAVISSLSLIIIIIIDEVHRDASLETKL